MLAHAEHLASAPTAEPASPQPCRFCGESHRFYVDPDGAEAQFLFDADLNIVRDATGEPVDHTDTMVWCRVCDAMAPLFFWNAHIETGRAAAVATVRAWKEYDDNGAWVGGRQ